MSGKGTLVSVRADRNLREPFRLIVCIHGQMPAPGVGGFPCAVCTLFLPWALALPTWEQPVELGVLHL